METGEQQEHKGQRMKEKRTSVREKKLRLENEDTDGERKEDI